MNYAGRIRWQYSMMFVLLLFASCKKNVVAAPPPPPTIAPAPAAAAPTITLRADNANIQRGQSAMLRWDALNATTVSIEPELGTVEVSGSRQITPASSVTYTATATGAGGKATDTVRLTVNIPPPAPTRPATPTKTPDLSIDDLMRNNLQTIYFEYDKAQIASDQVSRLQTDAAWLKEHPDVRFTVEGHCDERGSEEYNMGLGDRRANAVKDFLVAQGVPVARINTISYGEERPVCTEANEACYKQNRRAAFSPTR